MTDPSWRRIGKRSGPANVLGGRLDVRRRGSRWILYDLQSDRQVGVAQGHPTMAAARGEAELLFPYLAP